MADSPEQNIGQFKPTVSELILVYSILGATKGRPSAEMTGADRAVLRYFQLRIQADLEQAIHNGWIQENDWDYIVEQKDSARHYSKAHSKAVFAIMKRKWKENSNVQRTQRSKGVISASMYDKAFNLLTENAFDNSIEEVEDLLTDDFYSSLEP